MSCGCRQPTASCHHPWSNQQRCAGFLTSCLPPSRNLASCSKHQTYGQINTDLTTGTLGEEPEVNSIAVSALVAVSLLHAPRSGRCAPAGGG